MCKDKKLFMEPSTIFSQVSINPYCGPTSFNFSDYRGKEVGRLTWEDDTVKFSGNIEESAKVFFNYLQQFFKGSDK